MPEQNFSLKDQLFNEKKLNKIANEIKGVHPAFDSQKFIGDCLALFPDLELKERIVCISQNLQKNLPANYELALSVLLQSLPQPCDPSLNDNDFGDFIYASYSEFVANFGCTEEHVALSINALEEITSRFSAEYAIRNFINQFPDLTFEKITEWSLHSHYHVRRLASEGTRPKLPWGKKINTPIENALPILDVLHADHTRFVTRSVANHLNDISKTQADLVIETLEKWRTWKKQNTQELEFIAKHALRTLIKNGSSKALNFIGFENEPKLNFQVLVCQELVKMNNTFNFEIKLTAEEQTTLLIDYGIQFQTSKGVSKQPKMFKLKQVELTKGQSVVLKKSHAMLENRSTRKLYPGSHQFFLQVNGLVIFRAQFELKT